MGKGRLAFGPCALAACTMVAACGDDSGGTGGSGGEAATSSGSTTTAATTAPTSTSPSSTTDASTSDGPTTTGTGGDGAGGAGGAGTGTGGAGTGGSGGGVACTELAPTSARVGSQYLIRWDLGVELGEADVEDAFAIAVFSDEVGVFDLADEQEFATAVHDVFITVDITDDVGLAGPDNYFQESGTLTVDVASDGTAFTYPIAGSISDVVLRQVDQETGLLIPDGPCFHIDALAFDFSSWGPDCTASPELDVPSGGACGQDLGGCNPVTNEGCDPGQACDLQASTLTFQCFDPGPHELCDDCVNSDDPADWCVAGQTCSGSGEVPGVCHRYCCEDEDCGLNGHCNPTYLAPVGTCIVDESLD